LLETAKPEPKPKKINSQDKKKRRAGLTCPALAIPINTD
jgi:hypothetical protein